MANRISVSRILNIEPQEKAIVYLLLAQSVFLGIFAGALDVGANALFLDIYSADLMPRAFMFSGAVGILFTSVYTLFQRWLPFKAFTVMNLIFVIAVAILLRIGYTLSEDPRLTFALLVLMGPLIIISMLGFWGTAGRYFNLREGKRLFGIIDTGSIVGMIIAFYAVPVLMTFNFRVYDTLAIGFSSLVVALVMQILLVRKHPMRTGLVRRERKAGNRGFFTIFRKRYTSLMAVFIMISVVAGFFIHYQFMWSTEANYTNPEALTSFLGAFFGTMMIFTVIVKSTLYSWLMKNYGIQISLLISPVLLLVLTLIASFIGGIFGYSVEAGSFMFFFMIIALSKLFNKSLKDAIESPSMKTLYQSLDSDERFDVQARIDGVVNEFTAFLSGLIMAGLLMISFVEVIHFSYILIALLVAWVFIGMLLYRSYQKTLRDGLAAVRVQQNVSNEFDAEFKAMPAQWPMLRDAIRLDPLIFNRIGENTLCKMLLEKDPNVQLIAWESIANNLFDPGEAVFDKIEQSKPIEKLEEVVELVHQKLKISNKDVDHAFRSGSKKEIIAALMATIRNNDISRVPNLIALLRDKDMEIRKAAIEAAGQMRVKELGSYLVDYLGHPRLYTATWMALVNMGEIILDNLESTFYKSGVETIVQIRILRAMDQIGGNKAARMLFSKLNYHHRDIHEAVISALYTNGFVPNDKEKPIIHSAIYEAVLAGTINIASAYTIKSKDPGNGLLESLIEEKKRIDNLLFLLLGIAYDRKAVEHVKRSFDDEHNEDTGFALEMLNLIVEEEIFTYLESYLDDLPVPEKIRRLQSEMPVEILDMDELLIDILTGMPYTPAPTQGFQPLMLFEINRN